jgi:hypothetical protein
LHFNSALDFFEWKFLFLSKPSIRTPSADCSSLRDVSLPADSSLKMFGEFHLYSQLLRIQILVSVQTINPDDFSNCNSLHGVVFAPDCRISEIYGLKECESLSRIEIHSDSSILNWQFFKQHQKYLVCWKMSKKWSILVEVCSDCHMINKLLIDIFERSRCRFSENYRESRSWNKNKRWSVVSLTPGNHNRTNHAFLCRNRRSDCCYSHDLSVGYHHNFSPISWKKCQTVSSDKTTEKIKFT